MRTRDKHYPLARALLLYLLICAAPCPDALAQPLTIEVAADQRVTVVGRQPSLKTVIEDLCFRAGVDLLFYDAEDRPFGGTFRDLPLATLFSRLLRQESYLIDTVRVRGTDQEHVVALRVLGDPAVASARRGRGDSRANRSFQVPPALLDTAFGDTSSNDDSAAREAALGMLAARISGDPAQLQGFLKTDSRQIAEVIQRYKGVEQPLRELQHRQADARIVAKIDEILAALEKMGSEKSRR